MPALLQRLLALIAVIAFSPIFALAAAAILLLDGRPLMFNQDRLGQRRESFKVFKFRTMRDGKVTAVGRWLRASGIDELPQLFNVVLGDMNVVGPRPLTAADVKRLGWDNNYHAKRWSVKPGITGLAQLFAGHSKKLSWTMDNRYLATQSLFCDARIMLITFPMQLLGKYRVRAWLFGAERSTRIYGACRAATATQADTAPGNATQKTNWAHWHQTFLQRAKRPDPQSTLHEPLGLTAAARSALLRSLAIFQLGEGGEGRIAHQIDQANIRHIDDHYRQALKLFVAEEGRHARLLGRNIKAMGGQLLSANWTEKLFVFARRLIGIRLKLMVLLVAEVVGITCYRLIASRLPDSDLRSTLYEICNDETVHLGFHCAFFRTQTNNKFKRAIFLLMWWLTASAALTVVLLDHRVCLRTLNISHREFIQRAMMIIHQTGRLSIGHAEFTNVAPLLRSHHSVTATH